MPEKDNSNIRVNCPSCGAAYKIPKTTIGKTIQCKKCNNQFKALADMPTDYPLIGKIALEKGLINEKQLKEAWAIKRKLAEEHDKRLSIADILFKKKIISEDVMKRLKIAATRQQDKEFGIIAARDHSVSEEDIDKALSKQAEIFKNTGECVLIGNILTDKKLLTREQVDKMLSEQNRSEELLPNKIPAEPELKSEPEPKTGPEPKSKSGPEEAIKETKASPQPSLADKSTVEDQKATKQENIAPVIEKKPGSSVEGIKDKRFFQIRELDKQFGKIAISKNFSTKDEVAIALKEQLKAYQDTDQKKFLGKILIEKGVLTNEQFTTIMFEQKRFDFVNKKFGEIAIEKGFVRNRDIEKALEEQKNILIKTGEKKLIGEILVSQGAMSEEQCKEITVEQTGESIKKSDEGDTQKVKIKNCDFELTVSKDALSAFLKRDASMPDTLSASDIKKFLLERKIAFGIVDDTLIDGFLKHETLKGKRFKVAEGKPVKLGRKGRIKYFFDTEHLKAGAVNEDGNIDYKDRGEIPHVPAGELLAEKISFIEGEKGIDIYGIPIDIPVIKDVKLKNGQGTEISDDNLKVFAKIEGQPSLAFGGKISVLSDLVIKGDVGLKTGHVEFDGKVKVIGTIQSNFKVKAGSVTAKEIEEAEIITTGDVNVSGGINGATIRAGGNVFAKYITKATIFSFGDVEAQKEIIDSKIENSGTVLVRKGKIISSEIISRKGVEAMDIGTEMSTPCQLKIGVDTHVEKEIKEKEMEITAIENEQNKLIEKVEALKEEEENINIQIAEQAQIQDRSMIKQRSLKEQMDTLKKEGKKEQLADITKSYQELEKNAADADSSINDLFARQDEISDTQANFSGQMKQFDYRVNELRDEKEAILKWSREDKTIPAVKAKGSVYEGCSIFGPNALITLEKTYKNIHIKELRVSDPKEGADWEMKVIIQKS